MENVVHTINNGQRISGAYADVYFNDVYCDEEVAIPKKYLNSKILTINKTQSSAEWTSPSDLLIDIVKLKPPFTSKITRGKTHAGILTIGDNVWQVKQEKISEELLTLIHENDAAWEMILEHEKQLVSAEVNEIHQTLLQTKNRIMMKEFTSFYENSLQELEDHLRSEVQKVLSSVHARLMSNLNKEIKDKFKKEKYILEKILKTKYRTEEEKVKKYYKLLLQNELHRNNTLVHSAVSETNEALKAFFQQLEMENITNTMYVMSTERKKCKIKKFLLRNIHDAEIAEKHKKLKERIKTIDACNENEDFISDINKEWEEKIKKILHLFLKFISFSFKLLPDQSTFLLDFEKMVILQLNEIIQKPQKAPLVLVDKNDLDNTFKFEHSELNKPACDTEPIVMTGALEDPAPPRYGSRETLPSDVDLPTIRLQRQFLYAKCHEYEEIKKLLESQTCKCTKFPSKEASLESKSNESHQPNTSTFSESSNEPLLLEDIKRLHECPVRKCTHWAKRYPSSFLESYFDFSEENLKLVENLMDPAPYKETMRGLKGLKSVIGTEPPFASPEKPCHTVGTQYSVQENVYSYVPDVECTCTDNYISGKQGDPPTIKESEDKDLNKIVTLRRNSIKTLMYKHTELHKFFTDESFDFMM